MENQLDESFWNIVFVDDKGEDAYDDDDDKEEVEEEAEINSVVIVYLLFIYMIVKSLSFYIFSWFRGRWSFVVDMLFTHIYIFRYFEQKWETSKTTTKKKKKKMAQRKNVQNQQINTIGNGLLNGNTAR